ncbi:MAG: hypothetical protein IPI67_40955 [Myxococcales bacterium]|nr:hypothetical protein [Myxococcales bacterium]
MDCEKFDRIVLDLLYDELDELTSAAARRHMEHCARCRGIGSGLKATRQIGAIPQVEAPAGLEARILEAERRARAALPLRQRLGRSISVLAGYAMRPQLAMAALLLLMIGSSLLFLRAKPGARERVRITERGVPESENETVTVVPMPAKARAGEPESEARPAVPADREAKREKTSAGLAEEAEPTFAPSPPAAAQAETKDEIAALGKAKDGNTGGADDSYEQGMADYRAGRYAEAQKNFDSVATRGGDKAASAELFAAQAVRNQAGCGSAAPRFESINARHKGSGIGNEALWQAGDCYRALGQEENARRNYKQLLGVAGYDDRAQRALASLDQQPVAARKAAAKPAPPKTAAGAKPAEKTPPKAKPPGTSDAF